MTLAELCSLVWGWTPTEASSAVFLYWSGLSRAHTTALDVWYRVRIVRKECNTRPAEFGVTCRRDDYTMVDQVAFALRVTELRFSYVTGNIIAVLEE